MKQTLELGALLAAAMIALTGCNVGMAPAGPDPDQIRQEIAAMPPQKQIHLIQGSPMPTKQKQQKIAEIEQKYNIKADTSAAPSAPVPGGPTGN